MPLPTKTRRNRAIVHLRLLGWSFYSIAKALNTHKANVRLVFLRDKGKYPLSIPFSFPPDEQKVGSNK